MKDILITELTKYEDDQDHENPDIKKGWLSEIYRQSNNPFEISQINFVKYNNSPPVCEARMGNDNILVTEGKIRYVHHDRIKKYEKEPILSANKPQLMSVPKKISQRYEILEFPASFFQFCDKTHGVEICLKKYTNLRGTTIDGVTIKEFCMDKNWTSMQMPILPIITKEEELIAMFAQINLTEAHYGEIKAFHMHEKQDDHWFFFEGKAIVVLHDRRPDSSTFGEKIMIHAGEDDLKLISIPTGVAHGYKVISKKPCKLMYVVTNEYVHDLRYRDEIRIPYNDREIGYCWKDHKFKKWF